MADPKITLYPTNESTFEINITSGERGPKGDTGPIPQFSVENTVTGLPNTNAEVSINATDPLAPKFSFIIPQGNPFVISAIFQSEEDLLENNNPAPANYIPTLMDFAIIETDVDNPENARLYIYDDGPFQIEESKWTFLSDLSGATGPMRDLRWRPDGEGGTTSILEWRNIQNNGWVETEAKNLALQFSFDDTELTITNSDGDVGSQELGVYASFGDNEPASDPFTTLIMTNPDGTVIKQNLALEAQWSESSNSTLVITNPNGDFISQNLGLEFEWDGTVLGVKNADDIDFIGQKLSPDINFSTDETTKGVLLSIVEPGEEIDNIQISPNIFWDNRKLAVLQPGLNPVVEDYVDLGLEFNFENTDPAEVDPNTGVWFGVKTSEDEAFTYEKLSLDFVWGDGEIEPTTALGIKRPTETTYTFVNLKGETGNPSLPGTPLFRLRDQFNNTGAGILVGVEDELQIRGSNGLTVDRDNSSVFTINIIEIDGGDFPVSEPEE